MAFADPGTGRNVLNNGLGSSPPTVTLTDTVSRGDVLGISAGTWVRAFGDVAAVIQGRVVALESGVSGDVIEVSHCPVIDGYTGAAVGGVVYCAEGAGNEGEITQTAPSTTNDATTIIGIMLDATRCQFFLNSRADSLSS